MIKDVRVEKGSSVSALGNVRVQKRRRLGQTPKHVVVDEQMNILGGLLIMMGEHIRSRGFD